jgi:hypothetical protein
MNLKNGSELPEQNLLNKVGQPIKQTLLNFVNAV